MGGVLVSPSMVQTVGLADWVGLPNPHSCRYCGTNPGFDFLLVSLTWFKPRERLSLENGWMCQYPWDKNTGVSVGSRTGGKLTCHNSKTARTTRRSGAQKGCGRHPPRVVIRGRPATGSDPGIKLRGDLPKSRVRLLDWCANPAPSCGFDWVS